MREKLQRLKEIIDKIVQNVAKVIVGKEEIVELALVAILCDGHILAEDVPGVGKTMLARSLAKSIGCTFKRIQFTPDLLPSDVVGISVYNQKTNEFEFKPGPIMSQIVLADEINRATPRTQSSLLECMGERQVTVDGRTYILEKPFLTIATQNPIEYEGTFPLPEAQLDRFLMKIHLGYPTSEEELMILRRLEREHPIESIGQVVDVRELVQAQGIVQEVTVEESLRKYIVEIVRKTREHRDVLLGASPRGSIALFKTSQALAAIHGRSYVIPDDIKHLVPFVLSHRIILQPESQLRGITSQRILQDILERVEVPLKEESYA
ncbi:MAG: AAA family ATPase [bacterium]